MKDENMIILKAPDGTLMVPTIAPDLPSAMGYIKLLHKHGISKSLFELKQKGFQFVPVKVTIEQIT